MPRQRLPTTSQEKRSLEVESEENNAKRTKTSGDVDEDTDCIDDVQGENVLHIAEPKLDSNAENEDEAFQSKGDHSSVEKEEGKLRERSLSNSSSTEQRNRSLEALFQVTDTELQAISKQAPDGHHVIQMKNADGYSETLYVVDSAIQDREELVEEAEVIDDDDECLDIVDDDSEEPKANGRKDAPSSQGAVPPKDEGEVIDSPKWRQFKNIERILQNAGIDTSSKTWQTLTRPGRHICPYCQRACTKPSVLEKHIRAHTGERPYPCLVCGFAFKTKSNLYKHCKSRAHTLKTNVEAKKLQAQCLAGAESEDIAMAAGEDTENSEEDKKLQMEPAQRHVIQEVVKYLKKGQRPNEVQTERQRAKLERLKSMTEKGLSDTRKREDTSMSTKGIHRQLSLPVMSSLPVYGKGQSQQFQRIAPKESAEASITGVNNLTQILIPSTVFVNEKGEMIQTVQRMESVEQMRDQASTHPDQHKASDDSDSSFYNQIEIVNLPDPDTDHETSTKALRDLEELSEKFSAAAQDGLRLSTSVHSLPDKRVQVVLQLQRPVKKTTDTVSDVASPQSQLSSPRSALKERIQRLISANAAIVDTPKVEPPRAKCVKRNFSRQDSESQPVSRSEIEAAVSGLFMPNINSVPLQPLPIDSESGRHHGEVASAKNVVIENMESLNEGVLVINNEVQNNVLVVNNETLDKEKCVDKVKTFSVNVDKTKPAKQIERVEPVIGTGVMDGNFIAGKGVREGLQLSIASALSSKDLLNHSSTTPLSHKPTSSVIMSPIVTTANKNLVPGHIGKMALKNLQMRSKSLSSLNVASSPGTSVVMVTQPSISVSSQASSPYVLQTPTTPVGQVMLQGSNVPVLFLSGTSGATLQQFTPAVEQRPTVYVQQMIQPGLLSTGSQVVNVIQTPTRSPANPFTNVIPGQPLIVEQSASEAPHTPTGMTGVPLNQKSSLTFNPSVNNPPLRSATIQSPVIMSQPDPMKILSSIVSNTVKNHPHVDQTNSSQPKEIKIEIKLPPPTSVGVVQPKLLPLSSAAGVVPAQLSPLTNVSVIPSVSTVGRPRPPLKRQNPVSGLSSPSTLSAPLSAAPQNPVFRFQNSPTLMVQNKHYMNCHYRCPTAGSESADVLKSTLTTSKVPQTSVIKEYLLRQNSLEKSSSGQLNRPKIESPLFRCLDCHIMFKKKETLALHKLCYCKRKNNPAASNSSSEVTTLNSEIQTKIVSKLFRQSADLSNSSRITRTISNETVSKTPAKTLNKSKAESFDVHPSDEKRAKFDFPLERSKSVIISPMERKLPSRSETPVLVRQLSVHKGQDSKSPMLDSVTENLGSQEKGDNGSTEKVTNPVTTKKLKELWQSKLKGQILKRKLKGKLLMNRSVSLDHSMVEDLTPSTPSPSCRISLKARFSDIDDKDGITPRKRPRLVRSQESIDGITIKRPVFRRSKSVPELPKHDESATDEKNDEEDDNVDSKMCKEEAEDDWLRNVSVPVVTAGYVVNYGSASKPIYQQNFRMKSFECMGTPVQLMPSATLTPRPELMEMEKFRKTFSFESGSLKLIQNIDTDSPSASPVKTSGMKLPVQLGNSLDSGFKVTMTSSPCKLSSTLPSAAQKSPLVRQFSLVAHTYPSMRSMTHLTFCCAYQLQPSYVKSGKKVSMYSNWRVAQQNTNLLGLPTRALISLYNSKYTTNPVWVMNCGDDPRSGAITHSSYWKIKTGEPNIDTIFSLMDRKEEKKDKEKSKFEVGYKTAEESVYVRGRGRGKYVCETCGIRCKKPSMLKKHIRTHTDLRPYKCKYCQFSFKTKGNLQKHMKSKSHYKVCLDQGISPVPMTVDESQIDEEALQAQCYLSKRAKIVDKMGDSSQSLDRDISTTDDNDDDDDDDDYKMVDDGEDETVEGLDESSDNAMEMLEGDGPEFLQHEDKLDQRETTTSHTDAMVTDSQHNLFLQSLGIIAKHRLDGDRTPPVPNSLQLPMVTSLGISLASLNQFGAASSMSSAGTSDSTTNSSLSTVYGNLKVGNEGHPSVTKDSDVIWGLLNLSDQSKSTVSMNTIHENIVHTSQDFNNPVKDSKSQETTMESLSSSVTSQVKVNQSSSFLPPYLSMAATMRSQTTQTGPIIGQIIQNVTTKSTTSETSSNRAVTMPFQFQHPFPGSLGVMLASTSTDTKYTTSTNMDIQSTDSQTHVISSVSSDTEQKFSSESELMYVQIGNTQGQVDTIPAQIVNVDPAVFRGRIQESANVDPAVFRGKSQESVPEKVTSIPTENILQLRRVSDGLYVITTDTEIGKTGNSVIMGTPSRMPASVPNVHTVPVTDTVGQLVSVHADHVKQSASHVTGRASHVTGSVNLDTGSSSQVTKSANFVQQSEDVGRFKCTICKAAFPEHHQLILHGNVHFLENSRLKCEKCNLKFRSHSAYEKHLLSETHSATVQGKIASLDSADPRPYKCAPCNTAFRLKGHLTKHFRARAHFKNLEALGNIAIGTWEKLEHNVSEVDASTLDEFLAVVEKLLQSENEKLWVQPVTGVNDEEDVFIENDGSNRVLVEVNEEPYEMDSIGDNEKYRAYPLPGVFVEEPSKSERVECPTVPNESLIVKPHKCGLCGRGYETVAELKTHLITHAELRPYVCEYCDAGFTNAQSLKIHLYTHTQETPYVCGMCGLKFPNTQDLSQHCKVSHPPPGRSLTHSTTPPGRSQSHVAMVTSNLTSSSRSVQPAEVTQTVPSEHVSDIVVESSSHQEIHSSTVVTTTDQCNVTMGMESNSTMPVPMYLFKNGIPIDSDDTENTYAISVVEMTVDESEGIVVSKDVSDEIDASKDVSEGINVSKDMSEGIDASKGESNVVVVDNTLTDHSETTDMEVTTSNEDYEYVVVQEAVSEHGSSVVTMTTRDQSDITLVETVAMETDCNSAITSSYIPIIMSQSEESSSIEN